MFAAGMTAAILAAFTGCSSASIYTQAEQDAMWVADQHMKAFSRHDIMAVNALSHPDVTWMSFDGNASVVQVNGHKGIEQYLTGYFSSVPNLRSEVQAISATGPYITIRERSSWSDPHGDHAQTSIMVFEVRDGLIHRVWFYPPTREPEP